MKSFADNFEDDFGSDASSAPAARKPVNPASSAHPTAPSMNNAFTTSYAEKCRACSGTGQFTSWSGRVVGECFKCKGKGERFFKTNAADRAAKREQAASRKLAQFDANLESFQQSQPEVWAWIQANPTFEFAQSLGLAVAKYGYLTENQLAAAHRCIARSVARQEAAQARIDNAQAVDTLKLEAAFAKASSALKAPKLRVAGLVISPAKANSKNAGALYVKSADRYLGKIMGGKFITSRDCTPEDEKNLLAVANDPVGAAIAYGRTTGSCACCGRLLTDPESVERGIGPICAERFGW